jgi:hypothetical protein
MEPDNQADFFPRHIASSLAGLPLRVSRPLKFALVYGAAGGVWLLLEHYVLGGSLILKDVLFISVTAWLLYRLLEITGQKEARDRALRESQEKFQNLVETVNDLVWEVDENTVFTYVSPRVRDLLGYEPQELLGRTPFDLMPQHETDRIAGILCPAIAERKPFGHLEHLARCKDGHLAVHATSGVPFHAADGTFRGWRGISRDIGERKRRDEAIRRKEEQFRQMFEQNEEPVILFRSGTAEIQDANPAAVALYGYSREELVEKGPSLFVPPDDYGEFKSRIRGIDDTGALSLERVHHVRKDGAEINVSIRGRSIRLLTGGRISYCTFRDITARIRLEEEAAARQAQLIHAGRMVSLGMISSGVAHEINNPNNLVMFNVPLIRAAWKDAETILQDHRRRDGDFLVGGIPFAEMREIVPRLMDGIAGASARIKNIVEALKEFARPEIQDRMCQVGINEIVRAAVEILRHPIMAGCRNFRVECDENVPLIKGCTQQLEQVVINLVANSLQALPDKDRAIRVSTEFDPGSGSVQVSVRDEGVGMTPETLRRILEPFFSTRTDSGGLGLGLSISLSIIKAHKGTLEFRSEAGKGTTACIMLPADSEHRESGRELSVLSQL